MVATWAGRYTNPASFCNVVGLRPSIGRTPFSRGYAWYGRLVTTGPMAKSVADTSLLFSILAGPDRSDPLTLPEPGEYFLDALVPAIHDVNNPIKGSRKRGLRTVACRPSRALGHTKRRSHFC